MKKTFIFALLMGVIASFCACDGCGKKEGNVEVGDSVAPFVVENIISTDKQAMFVNHGGDYRWFETMILFNDFLDEETDGSIAEGKRSGELHPSPPRCREEESAPAPSSCRRV